MSRRSARYSTGHILLILTGLAGAAILYAGFYHPDPWAVGRWGRISRMFLIVIRIGIPLAAVGILLLFHGIKTGRIQPANVLLLFGSLILALILAVPFANARFTHWLDIRQRRDLYHPYLQLAPQELRGSDEDAALRIFCLGGSTTEFTDGRGRGWPDRVDSLLNAQSDKPVRVWNQGRQWYTSLHSLINYETNLRPHRPDAIIVMHTINDLLHNADFCYFSFGEFREDYRHFYGPLSRVLTRPTLLGTVWDFIGMFWYHTPREVVEQTDFPGLEPFKRYLNTLIDLAQTDGVTVLLMTQPNLYHDGVTEKEKSRLVMLNSEAVGEDKRWSYRTAITGFQKYTEAVKQVAAERNVMLVDLEQIVPKTLEFFDDDVHYRDTAFDLVAETVASEILRSPLMER